MNHDQNVWSSPKQFRHVQNKDKALTSQELRTHAMRLKKGRILRFSFYDTYQNSMHKCLISKVFTNIDKESEKIKFIAAQKISNSKTDFIGWVRSNTTTY